MYELFSDITRWVEQKNTVCLATVVSTWGSSPRQAGAKMAFTSGRQISGSVSGGCVEGAVIEAGLSVLQSGRLELLHYGVADETAFSVGLACGGNIEILVRRLDEALFQALSQVIATHLPAALLTVIDPASPLFGKEWLVCEGQVDYGAMDEGIDDKIKLLASEAIAVQQSQSTTLEIPGHKPMRVFVDVLSAPPVLVIVGGVHIAVILAALAKTLGYQTIVIDPRKAFGNPERFPQVDQLIQEWPEEAFQKISLTNTTSVAILTHDPKIDDPALMATLRSQASYIGVLGSRTTHQKRCQRLQAAGFTPQELKCLHAPIGMDLGGKAPQEIALGILAEIVAARYGKKK